MKSVLEEKKKVRQPGAPWSLNDASEYIGISRVTLWKLIKAGKIKTIDAMSRRLIPHDENVRRLDEPSDPIQEDYQSRGVEALDPTLPEFEIESGNGTGPRIPYPCGDVLDRK